MIEVSKYNIILNANNLFYDANALWDKLFVYNLELKRIGYEKKF